MTLPIKDQHKARRARRTAWLCLYAAVGKLVNATSKERRDAAEGEVLRHYDRLGVLGIRVRDGMPVEGGKGMLMKSKLEALFEAQLKASGVIYQREYPLHPSRRWKLDFACWRGFDSGTRHAAVEIQGGGGSGGHGTSKGIRLDCEKASACACLGWPLIKADATHVRSGAALVWLLCALGLGDDPRTVFDKKSRPARSQAARKPKRGKGLPPRVLKGLGL